MQDNFRMNWVAKGLCFKHTVVNDAEVNNEVVNSTTSETAAASRARSKHPHQDNIQRT